jgi:hypothetical protein
MKANRGQRISLILVMAASAMTLASCVPQPTVPAPTPAPAPAPAPPPPPRPTADWRDAPITPGNWQWGMESGQSVARFAGGELVLRCDPSARAVILQRRGGPGRGTVLLGVLTTNGTRQLSATAQPGPPPSVTASFAARDGFLDAIAFSRGRFAVEASGLATLYVPSWPEISKVVEDCR